ncbi:hypothetical protein DPMN_055725 [Dreissena polymorpha]|uniref:Uncharacterized protein n=1 Tax=Dreissena polymorpha TaxID=45954 RepID=A0A9D4HQW4_DREPO|nr:hypothetical protein DPMN_055725 [Dreissena polymorpha]
MTKNNDLEKQLSQDLGLKKIIERFIEKMAEAKEEDDMLVFVTIRDFCRSSTEQSMQSSESKREDSFAYRRQMYTGRDAGIRRVHIQPRSQTAQIPAIVHGVVGLLPVLISSRGGDNVVNGSRENIRQF